MQSYETCNELESSKLKEHELSRKGFIGSEISISSTKQMWWEHDWTINRRTFTNVRCYFNVREMMDNIVEFEKIDRLRDNRVVEWDDCYDSMRKNKDGSYSIIRKDLSDEDDEEYKNSNYGYN